MKNINKHLLGVMQGRLLPKYNGRYQAHPVGYWQDEFTIAADLGLDCIEFILDYNDFEKNPLISDSGVEQLNRIVEQTGVRVVSVCADYFMEAPLHSEDQQKSKQSALVLNTLLENGQKIGVKDIVIPCVDQSSLLNREDTERFIGVVSQILPAAAQHEINLSLETDLNPSDFKNLLSRFDSGYIKVNYDIGNSASLGYDPKEEFDSYGSYISDIHIKDRKFKSGSVELGTGDADFNKVLEAILKIDYTGPFIMQAYRDDEGLEIFKRQLNWVRSYLGKIYEK